MNRALPSGFVEVLVHVERKLVESVYVQLLPA